LFKVEILSKERLMLRWFIFSGNANCVTRKRYGDRFFVFNCEKDVGFTQHWKI